MVLTFLKYREHLEPAVDVVVDLVVLADIGAKLQVLQCGEFREGATALRHVGHTLRHDAASVSFGDVLTGELDGAGAIHDWHIADRAESGGLASAVRTQNDTHFAGLDFELDAT